jgi:hypothetical protein
MYLNKKLLKVYFVILINISAIIFSLKALCLENSSLVLAKQIIEAIKKDENNTSYTTMIDQTVMKQHTLSQHEKNQPYFYTNNRSVISEIISMVVERPDNVIDEINQNGNLKIYRSFNFDKDIAPLMIKDKAFIQSNIKNHLGATPKGPTNQVVVILQINDFQKFEEQLKLGHIQSGENIVFLTSYPIILDNHN